MRYLYNRKGLRRSEAERQQFAFFVAGALAVIAVVFVVGIQVGRVIERRSARAEAAPKTAAGSIVEGRAPQGAGDAAKEIASYAEDASKIESAKPASVRQQVEQTEKGLTFRRTLSAGAPEAVPLAPPRKEAEAGRGGTSGGASAPAYFIQAGAFRERAGAEALADRLAKNGFQAKVAEAAGKKMFRVLVGPFPGRGEAQAAARDLKRRARIAGFVVKG